jgi:hypothetical protein
MELKEKQFNIKIDLSLAAVCILYFFLSIVNIWLRNALIAYLSALLPLLIVISLSFFSEDFAILKRLLLFGTIAGILYIPLEQLISSFIDWGSNTISGPYVATTPLYAVLIYILFIAILSYYSLRLFLWSKSLATSILVTGFLAGFFDFLAENIAVEGGVFAFNQTAINIWHTPLFIPLSLGVAFSLLPLLLKLRQPVVSAILINILLGSMYFSTYYLIEVIF